MLFSAADFLLSASSRVLKKRSTIKIDVTTTMHPNSNVDGGNSTLRYVTALVEGRVRAVIIPDGFDPCSIVELVIDSDRHNDDVIVQFHKRSVENYYGFEERRVVLAGRIREDQPNLLLHPSHLEKPEGEDWYASELRTLKGSIYDIRDVYPAHSRLEKLDLALWDETYFTQVECFFVTDKERDRL